MDLVEACRAFVSVGASGSFTGGAAAASIPQPVASRRVAALEAYLGAHLFDRSGRRVALTPFGRDMMAPAQHLVDLAEGLRIAAGEAEISPLSFAVPEICGVASLAQLAVAARATGVNLDLRPAGPARRAELVASSQVRVAVVSVPADEAMWTVPVGLAGLAHLPGTRLHLDSLRPGRGDNHPPTRVWLTPEDDVPHLRDRLVELRDRAGLRPSQVSVATSLTETLTMALSSPDLMLASQEQAIEFGLHWLPLAEISLSRTFALSAVSRADSDRLRRHLWSPIARCLGASTQGQDGPS